MKKKELVTAIVAIFAVVLLYFVFHIVGIGCPIRYVTGAPCAGCGMTRAWTQVLNGNWTQAFSYHPLFWIIPIVLLLFWLRSLGKISQKIFRVSLSIVVSIFVIVYLYRLYDPMDAVIKIDFADSLIYRCYYFIRKGEML